MVIALPLIIGGAFGYAGGSSKKLFPLALFGGLAAMIWYASTLFPMHMLVGDITDKGLPDTLAKLHEKAPEAFTYAPLGMIGGYIAAKLKAGLTALSARESDTAKRKRIYADHKMSRFD